MKIILAFLAVIALSGCASLNGDDYKAYVAAQSSANQLATESQKPLVRLTAQPGQAITGLAGLEVYMPVAAQQIQQARPNEWIGLLGQGISVFGAVAGLKVSGDAAIGLADSVGKYSTQGYANIQAPQANISTVTTTTDASNRSTTDASNRSKTTGATSSIIGSYNPTSDSSTHSTLTTTTTDSSTHSTPTTTTGSYNPATSTTTTAAPAAEVTQ